ncbi:MFS transporter, SHS family, lactate transporter [Geosmithia morbida]|uniref:MFS transporter, SHS family, lactate transporter n=1 Tax=Geosmithia morbida TaxID=1094350 RepID=A0A9P4YQJ5_9HYPO|nr:MFS transporter, SHS family, lactate transporter [Geosmithia morbida]KAF4120732.1 MFS transporter, SHS family, lactate transporter [Geosmithia morbida]
MTESSRAENAFATPPGTYPADPLAKGVIPTAKQSLHDLFVWRQRVVLTNDYGETVCLWKDPDPIRNPISLMGQLTAKGWIFFLCGLSAWTADAFDFHALSIQTKKFSEYYDTSKTNITTAITLTLLLRSLGAAAFGLAGDKYGRKWPMVLNMIVLGVLQIATIYSSTFSQFLAVRSLFGLFMGGVYGNAIAMALEECPHDVRGLMSGILQQGYSLGYVFAACANLGVGGGKDSWKVVFWVAAGISIGVGFIRALFPESRQFVEARRLRKAQGTKPASAGAFWRDVKVMLAKEWKMIVYCTILMTWFNYFSHTSQDSYTTFMLVQKELDNSGASRASIIMKVGACVGGTIVGYLSQFVGRRRAIIVSALVSGVLIPAWILPNSEGSLSATGFFMQFFVQGAWGVVPIHLNELSPPAFRSSFPGVAYQLGNMISSPSAQIVNAVAEDTFITRGDGEKVEAYGPTMGVATAIIVVGIVVTAMFGPERCGKDFGAAVAGEGDVSQVSPEKAKEVDEELGSIHLEERKDSDAKAPASTEKV